MNLSGQTDGTAEHGAIELLLDPAFPDEPICTFSTAT